MIFKVWILFFQLKNSKLLILRQVSSIWGQGAITLRTSNEREKRTRSMCGKLFAGHGKFGKMLQENRPM